MTRRGLLLGAGAAFVLAGCSSNDQMATRPTAASAGMTPSTTTAPTTATTPSGSAPIAPTSTVAVATTASTAPLACVLTPELTAGPYYLDGPLARADITEGRPGAPMQFRVRVLGMPDCAPLAGAAVDVWHCDAGGEYSGFNGNSLEATQSQGKNDKRFLRGVQLTDSDGVATFNTIFPGWYEGRTVHIHLKVLDGGTLGSTYTGGHVAHVGQAFFEESTTARLLTEGPYLAHTGARTTNGQDSIYAQAGPGAITTMTAGKGGGGYVGEFTCMVDRSATPPAAPLF